MTTVLRVLCHSVILRRRRNKQSKGRKMKATATIPLSHLPLRPSTDQLLKTRGFHTVQEVQDSYSGGGLSNLAAELGTSLATAGGVWQEIQQIQQDGDHSSNAQQKENCQKSRPLTAQQLLLQHDGKAWQQRQPSSIITFCREIDQLLGGGVALGELTEIAGQPGAGKTQWGMQLAVDASLPEWAGGVCGETVYVDTEGSFSPERCYLLAQSLIQHIQQGLKRRQKIQGNSQQTWNLTPEDILQGIHVIRVYDSSSLQATLEGTLPRLAQERAAAGTPLKLVVVDSMAFPIRAANPPSNSNDPAATSNETDADFFVARTRQLAVFATQLAQLAANFRLAVVAINQMTTKFVGAGSIQSNNSHLVPALGESWAHAVTTRIILSSLSDDLRTCTLVKSPRLPSGSANYNIMECGVRGANHQLHPSSSSNKRRRSEN
jgi:RAD51-like protein 2